MTTMQSITDRWIDEAANLRRMTPKDGARYDRAVRATTLLGCAQQAKRAKRPLVDRLMDWTIGGIMGAVCGVAIWTVGQ